MFELVEKLQKKIHDESSKSFTKLTQEMGVCRRTISNLIGENIRYKSSKTVYKS
ncbi:Hypothetical protein FKW44_008872 [Caligus rogercresseyi]|uniref:Uncharacterized protein n=1 Tax=Caligus rogercresseyi TaxID=217165 RepID=A0A7T8HEL9_CALRO|nr:Hypothetical protein FKW44_008872 [Caligus rogercresseyi]